MAISHKERYYSEMKKFKVSGQICFRLLDPFWGLLPKPIDEKISGRKKEGICEL